MAVETLKDKKEIGGYGVVDLDQVKKEHYFRNENGAFDWAKYDEFRKTNPISICHSENMISFRIQDGPIKEVGVNGCQLDTLIYAAIDMTEGLNKKFPSSYNKAAIGYLNLALAEYQKRTEDRERRGVEGLSRS